MLRFGLLVCLLWCGITVSAQITNPDSVAAGELVDDIANQLGEIKRPEPKDIAGQLQEHYETGTLTEQQARQVYRIFSRLQADRYRLYPDITIFIESVNQGVRNPQKAQLFKQWLNVMQDMLTLADVSRRNINQFIDFSLPFFRSGLLYASSTRNWMAEDDQFQFKLMDGQPVIQYSTLTLTGFTEGDTLHVYNTAGQFFPLTNTWEGTTGTIRWEGTGLDPKKVYANFGAYTVDVTKSAFTVDSAQLHYKEVFTDLVDGQVTHNLRINRSAANNKYPAFQSYEKRIRLNDFVKGVDYEGGFRLEGAEIQGYGTAEQPAILYFKDERNEVQLQTRAEAYSIKPRTIASSRAAMVLYFGEEDSITHPGIVLKYLVNDRQLIATQGKSGIGQAPFYNSYHNLEMDFERLLWDLDEPVMNMTRVLATAETPARFYSDNFYDFDTYDSYRGVLSYNPIQQLFKLKQGYGTDNIRAEFVARAFNPNLSVPQVEGLLYQLVADGFIRYDAANGMVRILPKVDRYELASRKAIDHDHIRMKSETDTINAAINLVTRELDINGVYATTLNAKHFVHTFPRKGDIKVFEGRDLQFGGTMFAGKLDLHGKEYYFDYDAYEVDLRDVDSMVINIETEEVDEYGEPILEPIKTVFSGLSGKLILDDPNNKAGYQDLPGYPKLINDTSSFAYYDNSPGFDSAAYNRDDFFFEIDPFEIDSLNDFQFSKQTFSGAFNSGGIFPEIRQDLQLREDNSLGFSTATPDSGFPMYKGLARYYQGIDLSNRGLRGSGQIDYLNASVESRDFLFTTQYTQGVTESFTMEKAVIDTVHFPEVRADSVGIHWRPYEDSMLLTIIDNPFYLFGDVATLRGQLNLRTTGLEGRGTAEWSQALFQADSITFGGTSMRSDTSSVRIKSGNPEQPALELPNVNASFDFGRQTGFMTNNQDSVPVKLPYTLYETNMDRFKWDMADSTIVLEPGYDDEYAYFLSYHKGQDSLQFQSKRAVYDLTNFALTIQEIPHIAIADCWVIPPDLQVTVGEGAKIKPLEGAEILIDSNRQQFKIIDARLNILGRNDMRGSGYYEFVNRSGVPQRIPFQNIATYNRTREDTIYTYGSGVIVDSAQFELDPQILFKGEVTFDSRDSLMRYDGVAKVKIDEPELIRASWFKIDQFLSPDKILLDAYTPVSAGRDSVYAGIHQRVDSTNLYATMTGTKFNYIDNTLFNATGQLQYDPNKQLYTVAPPEYYSTGQLQGNVMTYNNATGDVKAIGKTDMDLDFGLAGAQFMGTIEKKKADTLYRVDAMIGLDFHLTDIVKDLVYNDLRDISFNGDDIDPLTEEFQRNYRLLVEDTSAMEEVMLELSKTGRLIFPKKATPPLLLLSDVPLYWDEFSNSFLGIGEVGVVSFNGEYIGKTMKCYIELGYRRSQDFFNLYLEGDDEWYFVNYQNKRVAMLTSNVNVNSNIINTKIRDRTIKEDGETLSFTIATEFSKERFFNSMLYLEEQMEANK